MPRASTGFDWVHSDLALELLGWEGLAMRPLLMRPTHMGGKNTKG
jgi:hypothetical protein